MLSNEGLELDFLIQKVDQIKQQIKRILNESFEAISHEMSFLPLPNCFEFFGFDFLGNSVKKSKILQSRFCVFS